MSNVFITDEMDRGDEMCFGINSCDSLLLTAHMSSFAFWVGYLMPPKNPVFYVADFKVCMFCHYSENAIIFRVLTLTRIFHQATLF